MSSSSSNQRTGGRLGKFDIDDLKSIRVAIRRSNIKVTEQTGPVPILRSVEEPERLIKVIHYRTDEGRRPIFDRDDIIVNKSEDVIEKWVCKCGEQKLLRITADKNKTTDQSKDRREYYANKSKTVRRSRSRSFENYKTSRRRSVSPPQSRHHKVNRYSRSPQPSTSSNRYDDKNSRKSRTPPQQSKDYRNKHDRSVEDYRELSKKSPVRYKNRSRSPVSSQQYRHRYNSRSPPSRHRRSPRRSRSRSPVYRSRRSRDRSRERRYSRSPTSRHVSRYSPHRHRSRSRSPSKREYKSVQVPAEIQYYPGEEYWIPGPLAPRFIPRGFIQPPPPPGVYPRGPGLIPRAPIILPPFHQPYRQRYPVYNNRTIQPQKPKAITNPTTTTNSSTTTTTSSTVATSQDSGIVVASSSSENNDKIPELSPKNDDNGNKE